MPNQVLSNESASELPNLTMHPKGRMKDRKRRNIESQAEMVFGRNDPEPCEIIHTKTCALNYSQVNPPNTLLFKNDVAFGLHYYYIN